METDAHLPVLLQEALATLAVRQDGRYVDATFGRGGHAAAILERLGPEGRLLALDRDPAAVEVARGRFGDDPRFGIEREEFGEILNIVTARGWQGRVDGVLMDLGVSSPQLDDPERGFSFLRDGPLDMRMDPEHGLSAAEWLARADEAEIARVLWEYGEERRSRAVARRIVAQRAEAPLVTTHQLASLVSTVPGTKSGDKHAATRSFQAIRIHVNDELGQVQRALDALPEVLAPGGRAAVISFHSLEDRLVKRSFRRMSEPDPVWRGLPDMPAEARPLMRLVGKHQRPSEIESSSNPRARSATLRAVERLAA
jgi:16S rRNA (cytosine1402-N4)-methyltransferase